MKTWATKMMITLLVFSTLTLSACEKQHSKSANGQTTLTTVAKPTGDQTAHNQHAT